jgi:hypothetical protein
MMNWKRFGRKRSWSNFKALSRHYPWRWGGSNTQEWMPTYVSILRIPRMIWVWRATVEYYIDRGKPKNSEKNLSQWPLSTTWIDPGANSSPRGERLATIDPSHGTAISALYWRDWVKLQKTSVSIASGRIFEARTSRIQSKYDDRCERIFLNTVMNIRVP